MLVYDPTINPQGIATLLAVLSAWLIPITIEYFQAKKRRDNIKKSIALYLDIMEMKVRLAIYQYFQPGKKIPIGKNSFENQNKVNHDIIEKLAQSEDLLITEREELLKFIRFYKISNEMKEEEEFTKYLSFLKSSSLRQIFNKSVTLEEEINRELDQRRITTKRIADKIDTKK